MILKTFGLLLLLFVIQRVWKVSLRVGVYRKGLIHRPGPCRNLLPIETGSEDIALASNGVAFISSGLKQGRYCESSCDPRISQFVGHIYKFDFNLPNKDTVEVNLPSELREYFSPHGMDLWEDPDTGEMRLFVVNHGQKADEVEILKYNEESNSFSLVRSVRHKLFTSLNDVVAVGPDSFYVANDAFINGCWRIMETLLGLPWCTVIYYDGETFTVVENGEGFNSLAISKDSSFVFLTMTFDQQVNIYERDQNDGSLKLQRSIEVGCMIDNIFVDHATGDIWFGCHISLGLFGQHAADIDKKAPSQVIRIHPQGPANDPFSEYELFSPFQDDGQLVSGSSSVVFYKNKMLIGTVVHKAAYCEITNES